MSLQPKREICHCRYENIKSSYKTVDNLMFDEILSENRKPYMKIFFICIIVFSSNLWGIEAALINKIPYSYVAIIIDDLGYETPENSEYRATIRPIANLLDKRYDLGSWTFATGQIPMDSVHYVKKYGKNIVSRMKALFNQFELKGKDLR